MGIESAVALSCLTAFIVGQVAAGKASYLFQRRLWTDEIVAHAIATAPTGRHLLAGIANGLDTNPPGYHLLLRGACRLARRSDDRFLRYVAFASLLAGLAALFVHLRLAFSPVVALGATILVWNTALLQKHAFEVRMYGPWFATAVTFSLFLTLAKTGPPGSALSIAAASLAFLVCSLHTLGALSVVLIVAAHFLSSLGSHVPWATLGVAAAVPLVFAALWALILRRQNQSFTTIWMSRPPWSYALEFGRPLVPSKMVLVTLVLWPSIAAFLGGGTPAHVATEPLAAAGLVGLLALNPILFLVSRWWWPLLEQRYQLPAVAGIAPLLATMLAAQPDIVVACIAASTFAPGAVQLRDLCATYWHADERSRALGRAIHELTGHEPVLFESPHELLVVCRYEPDLSARCYGLDFESGQLGRVDNVRLCFRDLMRVLSLQNRARLLRWEDVRDAETFYLVPSARSLEEELSDLPMRYPGFVGTAVAPVVLRLVAVKDLATAAS